MLVLVTPFSTLASIRVSEIMYDVSGADAGREWIEIVNHGSTAIDLSAYKLFEGGVNHKITATTGDGFLAPGAVAIIADTQAKFVSDWPETPGTIFDSAFSLSNSGEALVIRDADLKDQDSVTYTGSHASGNGLSLARGDDSVLVASTPTPGVYVAAPQRAEPVWPAKTETAKQKPALQQEMRQASRGAVAPFGVQSTHEDVSVASTDFGERKTSVVWVWAVGAAALSLLGVGSVYALKLHYAPGDQASSKEVRHRALQKEADTYEIIES